MELLFNVLKNFVYMCLVTVFTILVLATASNLILPLIGMCVYGSAIWLLLYLAEPFLLLLDIYVYALLDEMAFRWF